MRFPIQDLGRNSLITGPMVEAVCAVERSKVCARGLCLQT